MATYRIVKQNDKFRIEKRWCFFFWSSVDHLGKPFHYEHFSHGNDHEWYKSVEKAESTINEWIRNKRIKEEIKKANKPYVLDKKYSI